MVVSGHSYILVQRSPPPRGGEGQEEGEREGEERKRRGEARRREKGREGKRRTPDRSNITFYDLALQIICQILLIETEAVLTVNLCSWGKT